jgi:guanosine-3',5'-bis(diphosphate) 3'-pyrophosphohydrolase
MNANRIDRRFAYTSRMPSDGFLWQKAAAFAARVHQHHVRKDRQTPYFSHPARVALVVACEFGVTDEKILAAALLHDVIEDTNTDYDDLRRHFGRTVADIVAALSKDKRIIESKREQAYDAQLAKGPWQARLIKLADVYDNYMDATTGRWRATQARRIRRALRLAGNDPRLARARRVVRSLLQPVSSRRKK